MSFFYLIERGKYFIDFKNGEGEVGQGDPQHKPGENIEHFNFFLNSLFKVSFSDVTISMNEEVFLKIFNSKI
jgi:hypothetical protein